MFHVHKRQFQWVPVFILLVLLLLLWPNAQVWSGPPSQGEEPTPEPLGQPGAETPTPSVLQPANAKPTKTPQPTKTPTPTATPEPDKKVKAEIPQTGGRLASDGQALELVFGSQALTETLDIEIVSRGKRDQKPDQATQAVQTDSSKPQTGWQGRPFQSYSFNAYKPGKEKQLKVRFQEPVTVTYHYDEALLDALEVVEESLHFVFYNAETQSYEALPTEVNTTTKVLTAKLEHFSTYGIVGEDAGLGGPPINAFEVSLAQGQATYGYNIPLPAGPAGFGPHLTLQYSSGIPNSMPGSSDTGWVGIGWSLDPGRMTTGNITLNGVSETFYGSDTQHQTYLDIKRIDRNLPVPPGCDKIEDDDRYEVVDHDGTTYYFGTDDQGNGSTLSYFKHTSDGWQWRHRVYKLYKVVDVYGNTMMIEYDNKLGTAQCGVQPVTQSYPSVIRYTTNANESDTTAEYTIHFTTQHKGYSLQNYGNQYGDTDYKLTKITSKYNGQTIRELDFTYNTNAVAKTNRLTSLQISSSGGTASYPALGFDYEQRWVRSHAHSQTEAGHRYFLNEVKNNFGGVVEFDYVTENWSVHQLFNVVDKKRLIDRLCRHQPVLEHLGRWQRSRQASSQR